jgi:hypothetical protein
MPEAYPTPLAGQRLAAALLRSMLPQVARKTADTQRSATTTTSADPHLQFSVDANAVYIMDGWLKYDGDTAGDFKLQVTAPSQALGEWMALGAGNNVVGSNATPTLTLNTSGGTGYLIRTESADLGAGRVHGALGAGATLVVTINGTIRVGPTSGTVSLDWAQGTSSATATTLYTDSWLRLQRIA